MSGWDSTWEEVCFCRAHKSDTVLLKADALKPDVQEGGDKNVRCACWECL